MISDSFLILNINPAIMSYNYSTPRQSLNKAFLKVKPTRSEMESFKKNMLLLLDGLDESESEEHNKTDLGNFLRNTFYQPGYYINTKDRADFVIHNGPDSKSTPGVLVEVKKPGNKTEMVRKDDLKAKAFYELILYYLRERISDGNLEIKHVIATNVFEWFIFDAVWFEKTFAQNKAFIKQFNDFDQDRLLGTSTDFFYTSIAEPFVKGIEAEIPFTWFDLRDYEKPLRNADRADDAKLISLFKVLSPEHLLKLPFVNDSNTLDKSFYSELLDIIGLTETKSGSKKIIERKKEALRDPGSLIENTIVQLDTRDKISRLSKPAAYGESHQDRLFNVSLELVITWLNRILFLKLLEAQLIRYHKGDPEYGFLNCDRVDGFDDLDNLFFRVLARKTDERDPEMARHFSRIPYLNSSLFEPTELEQVTIFISNLQDHALIPILSSTVLKDNHGKRRIGTLSGLQYLFEFLDAYDFAGEGSEDIQEDNKTLINASVLGLIFEKINGYKDGSFFTPGFITMYMCKETIRRAVVQKFNETKAWNCDTLDQIYDKIEDRQEANMIINSLRICDPAVGSGHFLVSALNEIIAIKSDLKILSDRDGKRLKEYRVEVANDELVITDEEGDLFEYLPGNIECQRIQEWLFHEKQTIIENCLFGVDINPNSVKICRLRLWIELLKNAYYKVESNFTELETLPNIDINIKCGNSLISRYCLDADIRQALKKSKWSIDSYRIAVMTYRNAATKEEKRAMEKLIDSIKSDFEIEVAANDKRLIHLNKLNGDFFNLTKQTSLFDKTKKEKEAWNKKVKELTEKIKKLETELDEIKSNKIYQNAFEWRFEFPEVLNDDGDFVGFDVVIGNPPYGVTINGAERVFLAANLGKVPDFEVFYWFINKANCILKENYQFSYIVPNTILFNLFAKKFRLEMFTIWHFEEILDCTNFIVFEDATVRNVILMLRKEKDGEDITFRNTKDATTFLELIRKSQSVISKKYVENNNQNWGLLFKLAPEIISLTSKIRQNSFRLSDLFPATSQGLIAYDKYQGQSEEIIKNRVFHSFQKSSQFDKLWLYGEDVKKYVVKWNGKEYINYCDDIANPRDPKYFIGKRLLIREITNPAIYTAITEDELYNDPSIIIVKDNEEQHHIKLECVLAILNSKLATFYHFNSSPKATKGAFPKILVNDVNEFPIPKSFNKEIELKIIELINKVLFNKFQRESHLTHESESKIDRLVYELYGLTEEEIRIVEGS